MLNKKYFEELKVGDRFVGETVHCERDKMLWFAAEFDDQPMHLDPDAAKAMGLRDVIAPGAYIFALAAKAQRAIWNSFHMLPSGLGINISFLLPLYAGDSFTGTMRIVAVRPSSKPGRGWIDTEVIYENQRGEKIAEGKSALLIVSRGS